MQQFATKISQSQQKAVQSIGALFVLLSGLHSEIRTVKVNKAITITTAHGAIGANFQFVIDFYRTLARKWNRNDYLMDLPFNSMKPGWNFLKINKIIAIKT